MTSSWFDWSHAGFFRTPRVGGLVHTTEGGQHTGGLPPIPSSAQQLEAPLWKGVKIN